MKVLTAEQMREADRRAVAAGIPSLLLMENAAYAVLRALERRWPSLSRERIVIFCGKGNNGGDGLALGRLLTLHHRPRRLAIWLAYRAEDLTADAAIQLRMLGALGIPVEWAEPRDLMASTLAVESLLGTGSAGPLREPIAGMIEKFNSLPAAKRVSIDTPAGMQARVDLTISLAAPKVEEVLGDVGELEVVEIGMPSQFLESRLNLSDTQDFAAILGPRPRESHKGTFGHVAIWGGSAGKHGALNLAGMAALRAGAGYVTLSSPDDRFAPVWPDLMRGDPSFSDEALQGKTVLAMGPGLGQSVDIRERLLQLLAGDARPMVLDADALNCLSPWRGPAIGGHLRVMTPHPGEMRRLLGREDGDRILDAEEMAARSGAVVVLKGYRSVVAFPDGQTWLNPTGSPALAKAGSGDVLTGMIAALLAQFPASPREAILAAVYLHGRCGELAGLAGHERSSLASELPSFIAEALRASR